MLINNKMNKQIVVYPYSKIQLINKNEWTINACNKDAFNKKYTEW